jgi:hypothetical protein
MRAAAVVLGLVLGCSKPTCDEVRSKALALVAANKLYEAREARVGVFAACQQNLSELAPLDRAITKAEPAPPPPPPREPTPLELLASKRQIRSALTIVQPTFGDSVNTTDGGAAVFATWAAQHMLWSDLTAQPETKHALVLKDPALERGKRLCSSGTLAEIQVDRTVTPPVYVGGVVSSALKVTRFVAVRSTGDLVENSQARLCGIVTGTQSYTNAGGGSTQAVFVVGMFDLPENKR